MALMAFTYLRWVGIALSREAIVKELMLSSHLRKNRGFGYIDYSIPELAMAVIPEHRGQGIGTKLLMQVLESAQSAYPILLG